MLARTLQAKLRELAETFPAVFLTGPRQSGKTTLSRSTFPDFAYFLLADLQVRAEAREDPRGFLARLERAGGVILDEVQRAPDLFSYLQGALDERRLGPVVLTGSQQLLLNKRIGQSLAGRVAVLELLPLSMSELLERPSLGPGELFEPTELPPKPPHSLDHYLTCGLFPRVHVDRLDPRVWLEGYIRAYVERDIRQLANVGDLDTFIRFVALCAGRVGQLINFSSLASDAGISHTTAKRWISALEASYIVWLLRPHHRSFSKRLVKSPKLYFVDSGLASHLLGVRSERDMESHPLRGALFECFVMSELRKSFLHRGERPPLYFWRDLHGHEVDVLVELGGHARPVEVKSGRTVAGDAYRGLDYYASLSGGPGGALVYGGDEAYPHRGHALVPWWACS